MSDPWVLAAQQWANANFQNVSGYLPAPENGLTGWPTMYSLTRGLQHLLGITALSDTFGPVTLAALTTVGNIGPSMTHANKLAFWNLVVAAMYCKGYNGNNGDIDGTWTATTTAAGKSLRADIGLSQGDGSISPKVVKALLTMDPFVLTSGGSSALRSIQQNLNARYLARQDFFVIATNGFHSRGGQTALIYALQYELGLADGVANGNFGPTTRSLLQANGLVSQGSIDTTKWYVHTFQAALVVNGYPTSYDGVFSATTKGFVESFQAFVALPVNGAGNFQTWASLLVSTGDTARVVTAADTSKTITGPRATTLLSNGYATIGRYLTNTPGSSFDKDLNLTELDTILNNGIAVFPIFQEDGTNASFFTFSKGMVAGARAFDAARGFGFKEDTVIYFAVDFDALEQEVRSNVVPYFQGVNVAMAQRGHFYRVGIYGSRNTCSIVSNAGLAVYSFVADMSTAFSGNLGFALPANWAFDQILEYNIGSGSGLLDVDKNVKSGRDGGQTQLDSPSDPESLDVATPAADLTDIPVEIAAWLNANMTVPQQLAAVRLPAAAANITLGQDALVTSLARGYRMRKSLIQTASMWESALENQLDLIRDDQVQVTYDRYFEGLPAAPVSYWDSSTGTCQIFGATAIDAITWGRPRGLTTEPARDVTVPTDLYAIWSRLRSSEAFSLSMCALVLLKCAFDAGLDIEGGLEFSESDVKAILTNYNGDPTYGDRNYGLYEVLEFFNSNARDGL